MLRNYNVGMDSTSNIHRRFNLLFTLPSTVKTTALLFAVSLTVIFSVSITSKIDILAISLYAAAFEVALFTSIIIERAVLKSNPLATFRRLEFVSVVSNGLWLIPVSLGYLSFSDRFSSLVILGAFFSMMLRLLVFNSVFLENRYAAFAASALQPLLLTPILAAGYTPLAYIQEPLILGGGLTLIAAVLLYLELINRSGSKILKVPPLTMFQAFLKAWSSEEPSSLEEIIEGMSMKTTVRTSVITFTKEKIKTVLIVPEVHPGPFYPIGSSNLPFQIHSHFSTRGFSPLVLHGVSGHELNLTSRKEVENLLSSYRDMISVGGGDTCSRPVTVKLGKTEANGVAFGDYALVFLTLAPNGMEDFPREIKEPLDKEALKNGFKHLLLVDTHNSQGSLVDTGESSELIEITRKTLQEIRKAEQHAFKTGFAHSSELEVNFPRDVGPAGVGVLVLEVGGERYMLISVDANNARRGLREEVITGLEASGLSVVEICTSDTHVTAGKVITSYGYMALGDETRPEYLVEVVKKLYLKASANLSESIFEVRYVDTKVKVVGTDLLNDISRGLDKVTRTARKGGLSLTALSILILVFSVLV